MKIEGHEQVQVAPSLAWRMINDPEVLKACTPGLERLAETQPDHFDAELSLKLPLLTGRFTGSVDILEREAPRRLRLRVKGKGPPGFVNGEATLQLAPEGAGSVFRYEAEVSIGGQIARLGQRMLSGATKEMAGQFFEAFERRAQADAALAAAPPQDGAPGAAASPPAAPGPLRAFVQLVWRTFLNLLGLSRRSGR